jgi:plasmid stabilization system protein ParE
MRLEFHRNVASDIARIIEYYEAVAGPNLADDFYSELRSSFKKAANSPEAYDGAGPQARESRKISIPFSISDREQLRAGFGSSSP